MDFNPSLTFHSESACLSSLDFLPSGTCTVLAIAVFDSSRPPQLATGPVYRRIRQMKTSSSQLIIRKTFSIVNDGASAGVVSAQAPNLPLETLQAEVPFACRVDLDDLDILVVI